MNLTLLLMNEKSGLKAERKNNALQHRIKLMASPCLLTKILADFLSGVSLLNKVLKHATNFIQNRYSTL